MVVFRWSLLKITVLSVFFGFLSGILGGLLISSIYAPVYGIREELSHTPVSRNLFLKESERIEHSRAALVAFYSNKHPGAPTANDRLGYGSLLTADGWIVTTQQVLKGWQAKQLIAITGDRSAHSVEQVIFDNATEAVFVRIAGSRFTPLATAAARDLSDDSTFLTGNAGRLLFRPKFLGIAYADGKESDLQASEKLNKYIFFTPADDLSSSGGPLINASGELVGVIADASLGRAIPFEYLSPALRSLLKTGQITRAFLGINYSDLGASLAMPKEAERGAYVRSLGIRRGVLRGSPAAEAGFKDGDTVLNVDGTELNFKTSLSEAVSEYQAGAKIEFLIRHADGKEEIKEVTLR